MTGTSLTASQYFAPFQEEQTAELHLVLQRDTPEHPFLKTRKKTFKLQLHFPSFFLFPIHEKEHSKFFFFQL